MIKDERWLAVRCCCQPAKVLGFLKMDEKEAKPYMPFKLKNGEVAEVRAIEELSSFTYVERKYDYEPIGTRELAVYSEDRGIDFWRTVPDFLEVK